MQADASVFSFISSIFSSSEVKAEEIAPNSQNMALLQAVISPMPEELQADTIEIIGGTSLMPDVAIAPTDSKSSKTISDDQISVYVVRKGDTLPEIAKMFNVTVNTIRWGNDIKGNTVTVGQTLIILPISGVQHTVKAGDTLESIARQHKGDLEEVLQYNNLSKDAKLALGDVIIVPDGEIVTVTPTKKKTSGTSVITSIASGYYVRPVVGGVKSQGLHGHNGVDLVSAFAANILAAAAGEVIISRNSGYNGGYGSYVVIKHGNGTQTLYAHLSATTVSVGDKVVQGQIIGKMGSTGKSTGTHLHFEVRGAKNPF